MNFSIIIVSYNTKDLLQNCLKSIFANFRNNYEVIVVDNNSTDGSLEILEKNYLNNIKLIKNKKNLGFGAANNQGSKIATGQYLFFLNSDTIINSAILNKIYWYFSSDPSLAIISPRLIMKDGDFQKKAFGRFPNIFNTIFRNMNKSKESNKDIFYPDWVSGAAMIIRKKIFENVDGFDENFFMYFEDVDLCLKVRRMGYKIAVSNKDIIIHFVGKSNTKLNRKKIYFQSQNYYYKKNCGFISLYLIKFLRLPFYLISLINFRINKIC